MYKSFRRRVFQKPKLQTDERGSRAVGLAFRYTVLVVCTRYNFSRADTRLVLARYAPLLFSWTSPVPIWPWTAIDFISSGELKLMQQPAS